MSKTDLNQKDSDILYLEIEVKTRKIVQQIIDPLIKQHLKDQQDLCELQKQLRQLNQQCSELEKIYKSTQSKADIFEDIYKKIADLKQNQDQYEMQIQLQTQSFNSQITQVQQIYLEKVDRLYNLHEIQEQYVKSLKDENEENKKIIYQQILKQQKQDQAIQDHIQQNQREYCHIQQTFDEKSSEIHSIEDTINLIQKKYEQLPMSIYEQTNKIQNLYIILEDIQHYQKNCEEDTKIIKNLVGKSLYFDKKIFQLENTYNNYLPILIQEEILSTFLNLFEGEQKFNFLQQEKNRFHLLFQYLENPTTLDPEIKHQNMVDLLNSLNDQLRKELCLQEQKKNFIVVNTKFQQEEIKDSPKNLIELNSKTKDKNNLLSGGPGQATPKSRFDLRDSQQKSATKLKESNNSVIVNQGKKPTQMPKSQRLNSEPKNSVIGKKKQLEQSPENPINNKFKINNFPIEQGKQNSPRQKENSISKLEIQQLWRYIECCLKILYKMVIQFYQKQNEHGKNYVIDEITYQQIIESKKLDFNDKIPFLQKSFGVLEREIILKDLIDILELSELSQNKDQKNSLKFKKLISRDKTDQIDISISDDLKHDIYTKKDKIEILRQTRRYKDFNIKGTSISFNKSTK